MAQQVRCWASCLLLGLGLWLLVRRFGGALVQPLDFTGSIAAGLVLILLSGGSRWWNAKQSVSRPTRADQVLHALATVGILTSGVALSLPGSPRGALVLFWCILLTAEAAWFAAGRFRGGLRRLQPDIARTNEANNSPGGGDADCDAPSPLFSLSAPTIEGDVSELLPPGSSQRISRSQDEAGGEIVSGLMRCSFAPSERQRDLHLAFCPPLKRIPQFSAEQVEGPPARIRPSQVETFGVGLEVKLAALSNEPTSVQIQFFACEEPIAEDAG